MNKIAIQCEDNKVRQVVRAVLEGYKAGKIKKFWGINLSAFKSNKARTEALMSLFERTDPPKPGWRAEQGGEYYYINELGYAVPCRDEHDEFDDVQFGSGNYFRTEEAAKIYEQKWQEVFGANSGGGEGEINSDKPSILVTQMVEDIEELIEQFESIEVKYDELKALTESYENAITSDGVSGVVSKGLPLICATCVYKDDTCDDCEWKFDKERFSSEKEPE